MGVFIKSSNKKSGVRKKLIMAAVIAGLFSGIAVPASADVTEDLLNKLRAKGILTDDEYQEFLQQARQEQKEQALRDAKAAEDADKISKAQAAASSGVKVKFGGFIEAATIHRDVNEDSDMASSWKPVFSQANPAATNGIPYDNTAAGQTSEFRESARQSRVSMLVTGTPDENTTLTSYLEADFLGAAQTANSNETNSYTPRLRVGYATYDRNDWGLHFLAGQSWSLATQNKVGMTPRTENVPLTIDAQYVPGFNFTRNPQIRLVKDFDNAYWLGLSLESPQTLIAGTQPSYLAAANTVSGAMTTGATALTAIGAAPFGFSDVTTAVGGSGFNTANNNSTDPAPDVILKAAADPGWGHYEIYGLWRWFRDRINTAVLGTNAQAITGAGTNVTTSGSGIGGSILLPVVPKILDLQASFLTGHGIGRYGAAQLPDVTYNLDGSFAAIKESDFLFGADLHATPEWDIWGYFGKELADTTTFQGGTTGVYGAPSVADPDPMIFSGYGLPQLQNLGCTTNLALSPAATNCQALAAASQQWTLGTWWKFYKGTYGTMQWGASYSHTHISTFAGINGAPDPDMNVWMVSFRYYPFQ